MYQPDVKITDLIGKGDFTLSAEVIPPRNGANRERILAQIESLLKTGAEFLSVTKGAGGSLRGGSLPIAQAIKEQFGFPCIAHFTCRDILPEEVENQLVDHHYFGIRNILALRGDPPQGEKEWKARPGAYNYAYELIEQIKKLNQGKYLERPGFKSSGQDKTDFCIGCAVYPDHPNQNERIEFFRKKVEAGAEYGITQMVFDHASYGEFLETCSKERLDIPILLGTRILKSKEQAKRMTDRFDVPISKKYFDSLPDETKTASQNQITDCFLEFVEDLKAVGAPGIHLFVINDTDSAIKALATMTTQPEVFAEEAHA